MKYMKWFTVLLFSGFLLGGCASIAHVEKDKTVDFSKYRSYAWVETKAGRDDTARKVSDLTERTIRSAVNAELARAGWKESKKPDVLLTYDVLVERSVRERADPVYSQPFTRYYLNPYSRRVLPVFYPSQFMGFDRSPQAIREGTITISLIDAHTDKTIWQGWSTDEVSSRNLTSREIQAGVRSIFRKFDIAKN
jgi:hypothetical protein